MSDQRDLFLQDAIAFPVAFKAAATIPLQESESSAPSLKIGDRIRSIKKQADGSQYRDGIVKDISPCKRFVKVEARRNWSPWHNCMRTVWVNHQDCEKKGRRKKK